MGKVNQLSQDALERCFQAGQDAFASDAWNQTTSRNPHQRGTNKAKAWNVGYELGIEHALIGDMVFSEHFELFVL